jgi:fructuronate reductase
MIAAWAAYLSAAEDFQDPLADDIKTAKTLDGEQRTAALLALLSPGLAGDSALVSHVHRQQDAIAAARTHA